MTNGIRYMKQSLVEIEPYDAHVQHANKVFRDCGFTIAAMKYKRPIEALIGLKRFNGLKDDAVVPFAWGYFPNEYMRDNWQRYYGALDAD